jgi:hypothetical protein
MNSCPIDCIYGMWSDWSACSVTCGSGTQTWTRTEVSQAQNGGAPCDSSMLTGTQTCDTGTTCFDGNCEYGNWGSFGSCTSTCQGGTQTRTRDITMQGTYGTQCTTAGQTDTEPCNAGVACRQFSFPHSVIIVSTVLASPCTIANVDPMSQPSSNGYKSVGTQADCNAACLAETSFVCGGYMTTGRLDGLVSQLYTETFQVPAVSALFLGQLISTR